MIPASLSSAAGAVWALVWPPEPIVTVVTAVGSGVLTFLTVIWPRFIRPVVKARRDRLRRLDEGLDTIKKIDTALGPNGGRSLHDAVNRVEKLGRWTAARVTAQSDLSPIAQFEMDERGTNIHVNRAFEVLFGFSAADMEGMGWVAVLAPDDRNRFVSDWQFAVADRRIYSGLAKCLTKARLPLVVRMTANPIRDEITDQVLGWCGVIEPVITSDR